ncbi:DUF6095 family protein [Flavobacterium tegetincola]|uniref:DUF6095 family protein n=1 Tax=Flavobacterium tegetincola TaxID=150172 RepID=UPI0004216051|nr:DUF6095 family protein [Flavobacterium tegetincola]
MATNKEVLNRGIVFMAGALPLMFIGPAVIHFAFINKQQPLHWAILIVGIAMCIGGVFLAFKGLIKITNSLFKSE